MATIVDPYTATAHTPAVAAEINARIAAILAQVNGNIDHLNLKDGEVQKVKLAADALQAFVQLATPATRKYAAGRTSPGSWGGANTWDFVLTHNLNDASARIIVMCDIVDTFSPTVTGDCVTASVVSRAANTCVVRLRTTQSGFTNNAPAVDWMAITS